MSPSIVLLVHPARMAPVMRKVTFMWVMLPLPRTGSYEPVISVVSAVGPGGPCDAPGPVVDAPGDATVVSSECR